MKIIKDIVISTTEPTVNNVGWLKPVNGFFMLFFFGEGGWMPVKSSAKGADMELQYIQDVPDIITGILRYGKGKENFRK